MGKACHKPLISLFGLLLLYKPRLAAHGNLVNIITDLLCHVAFPYKYTAVEVAALYVHQGIFDKGKLAPDTVEPCQKIGDHQQGGQQRQQQIQVDIHAYTSLLNRYPTPRTV